MKNNLNILSIGRANIKTITSRFCAFRQFNDWMAISIAMKQSQIDLDFRMCSIIAQHNTYERYFEMFNLKSH